MLSFFERPIHRHECTATLRSGKDDKYQPLSSFQCLPGTKPRSPDGDANKTVMPALSLRFEFPVRKNSRAFPRPSWNEKSTQLLYWRQTASSVSTSAAERGTVWSRTAPAVSGAPPASTIVGNLRLCCCCWLCLLDELHVVKTEFSLAMLFRGYFDRGDL